MVAYLNFTKNYARTLNYNEQKVHQGMASLIHSKNFLIEHSRMTLEDRRFFLKRLSDMNDQVRRKTLHAKLMMHPDECLPNSTLAGIADRYMELTGFKDQPYLVYRHDDAGEQHIHIISSLITEEGKRIDTGHQPWAISVQAAQTIEKEYGLKKVERHHRAAGKAAKAESIYAINYGEKYLIQSVGSIINMVREEYKFTSMAELNALLRSYNLYADQCAPGSRTWQHRGLYYRILDEEGKNCCAPVKSSVIEGRPGLRVLERKFGEDQEAVREAIPFIGSRINWILFQEPGSLSALDGALKVEGIDLIIGSGDRKYPDLFYIDHQSRVVVSSQLLGKACSSEELFQKYPDILEKHHTQVPQRLGYLLGHSPGGEEEQQAQQQKIRIHKHK